MRHGRFAIVVTLALLGRLAVAPPLRSADRPGASRAGSAGVTPGGTKFTLPAGWTETRLGEALVLAPPEPDLRVVLLDVEAANAAAAVAVAWKAYEPGFDRAIRLATSPAPRNGWEERHSFEYDTAPNDRRSIRASAYRAGNRWLAILFDAGEATAEKRSGPTGLLYQSLRPEGFAPGSFAGRSVRRLDEERLRILRDFVADGMRQLEIPGVGLAFLDHGKVAWAGGLGVRELGRPEPVDGDTLFLAASNTKALTTLLIAQLVDEGKLRWDQPVVEAYPTFALGDAATTRSVLIKHLVCACTGMPRQDMEWLLTAREQTAETTVAMLARMQPTSGFGEVFQYSNLMAAAGGYVAAAVIAPGQELGASFDRAMRERIFAPLGMSRTTLDFAVAMSGNFARPHGIDLDGRAAPGVMAFNYTAGPARPAGGMWTSANDLIRYVAMELAGGKGLDGLRIVSSEGLVARQAPQVLVGENMDYGMGLLIDRRWGIPVVRHGGDLAGYHSDMMWLPEHGVGVVVLTNGDWGHGLRGPLLRRLVEVLFDGKPEAAAQLQAAAASFRAAQAKTRAELIVPPDTRVVARLADRYVNTALGEVWIRRRDADRGGGIFVDVGELASSVAMRVNADGTASLVTIDPTLDGFVFVIGERGGKRWLTLRDAQHEYVFVEAAAEAGR